MLDAACKHSRKLLDDLLGRSSEKSGRLCRSLFLFCDGLDDNETIDIKLIVYNRLHHRASNQVAGEENRSLVESRAVAAKIRDPSQASAVIERPEIDRAKNGAGNSVPKERFVSWKTDESRLEALRAGLGLDANMVVRDAQYENRKSAGKDDGCSNTRRTKRKPGPKY